MFNVHNNVVVLRSVSQYAVTIQVVSTATAWVSIGFPSVGLDMIPADAVIGLPGNMSALEYEMTDRVGARLRP